MLCFLKDEGQRLLRFYNHSVQMGPACQIKVLGPNPSHVNPERASTCSAAGLRVAEGEAEFESHALCAPAYS